MATDVVPPPFGDHVHRIRTTVPCPPAHDIGQLADVRPERAGNRGPGGDPRDPGIITASVNSPRSASISNICGLCRTRPAGVPCMSGGWWRGCSGAGVPPAHECQQDGQRQRGGRAHGDPHRGQARSQSGEAGHDVTELSCSWDGVFSPVLRHNPPECEATRQPHIPVRCLVDLVRADATEREPAQ